MHAEELVAALTPVLPPVPVIGILPHRRVEREDAALPVEERELVERHLLTIAR